MTQVVVKRGAMTTRVWFDELPDEVRFPSITAFQGLPVHASAVGIGNHGIAAEAGWLPGHHWYYALLGGQFIASHGSEFRLEACSGTAARGAPSWTVAQPNIVFGAVTIGLPEWAARSVAAVPPDSIETPLPPGVLRIDHGVEAEVAISSHALTVVTLLVLQILAAGELPPDEEALLAELRKAWRKADEISADVWKRAQAT